jgi:hypothetical protein
MGSPVDKSNKFLMSYGQRQWVPLIRVTEYVIYASALVVRQIEGIQHMPRTIGLSQFSKLFNDQSILEVV